MRTHPPLASQFRQRTRGVTIDHRLYVVEWTIGDAGRVDPVRIVEPMLASYPSAELSHQGPRKKQPRRPPLRFFDDAMRQPANLRPGKSECAAA